VQFDFVDEPGNENSVLEHSIHLLQLLSLGDCYSRDKLKNDYFNNRKQETRMEKFVLLSPH